MDFSHFNEDGRGKMVEVGEKNVSSRKAIAKATIEVNKETMDLIKSGGIKKGDALGVAQIAGILGAKKTPDIIPMCHPLILTGVDIEFHLDEEKHTIELVGTVTCTGKTGVEMEALTAVSIGALTVYDMCKAIQKDIVIKDIRLIAKEGGKSGIWHMGGNK